MSIISDIREILREIPLSDILREKLSIAERSIEQLEKENIDLKNQYRTVLDKINELEKELSAFRSRKDDFIEERGALFKRRPEGGYHEAVFCPKCRMPMVSVGQMLPYTCGRCNISVDFTRRDFRRIFNQLPK